MSNMNPFLEATRVALRFSTQAGDYSVEDLWRIPLHKTKSRVALVDIAQNLHNELTSVSNSAAPSWLTSQTTKPTSTVELELKLEVVRQVYEAREEEHRLKREAAEREVTRAKIKHLIELRKDEALSSRSLEDLEEMLKQL